MAYTYIIKHKQTGHFYYGVKYGKKNGGTNPANLGKVYFSSSKQVQSMIERDGIENFDFAVRRIFENAESAIQWERKVIMRIHKNPLCLNVAVPGIVPIMTGERNPAKRAAVKKQISETVKRKWVEGSYRTRAPATEETKRKISESRIAELNPAYGTAWCNNGAEEKRIPLNEIPEGWVVGRLKTLSGFKYTELICPHCGKTGGGGNMKRYHFDNCLEKYNE